MESPLCSIENMSPRCTDFHVTVSNEQIYSPLSLFLWYPWLGPVGTASPQRRRGHDCRQQHSCGWNVVPEFSWSDMLGKDVIPIFCHVNFFPCVMLSSEMDWSPIACMTRHIPWARLKKKGNREKKKRPQKRTSYFSGLSPNLERDHYCSPTKRRSRKWSGRRAWSSCVHVCPPKSPDCPHSLFAVSAVQVRHRQLQPTRRHRVRCTSILVWWWLCFFVGRLADCMQTIPCGAFFALDSYSVSERRFQGMAVGKSSHRLEEIRTRVAQPIFTNFMQLTTASSFSLHRVTCPCLFTT